MNDTYVLKNVSNRLGDVLDELEDVLSRVGQGVDDPQGNVGSHGSKGRIGCKKQRLKINHSLSQTFFSRL